MPKATCVGTYVGNLHQRRLGDRRRHIHLRATKDFNAQTLCCLAEWMAYMVPLSFAKRGVALNAKGKEFASTWEVIGGEFVFDSAYGGLKMRPREGTREELARVCARMEELEDLGPTAPRTEGRKKATWSCVRRR